MIFVKETRPKIVAANPNMGALEVMQEVGRAWQSMTETDRKYFKDKADKDKNRYLAESRTFYDEVARVGQLNTKPEVKQTQKKGKNDSSQNQVAAANQSTDSIAGKKRPAPSSAKKVLQRSTSMTGKRATNSVMAIGLAPDALGVSPSNTSAQKRMRAESKFTFKPDELSENENSRENDFNDQEESEDSDDDDEGEGMTARKFFAKEYKEIIAKEYPQVKSSVIRQAVRSRWIELGLKQR